MLNLQIIPRTSYLAALLVIQRKYVLKENDTFLFLNLYLDDIPKQQYLFLSVIQTESWPILRFSIKNENGIDENFFKRISSHYTRLDLCRRFEEASGQYLSEIQDSIHTLKEMGIADDDIKRI